MGMAMIGMGILTILGGFAYTGLLADNPLTADMSWIGVVGGAISSMAWFAFAAVLGQLKAVREELAALRRGVVRVADGAERPTAPLSSTHAELG